MSKGCVVYSDYKSEKNIGKNEGDLSLAMEGVLMKLNSWLKDKNLDEKYRLFLSDTITFDEIYRFRRMRCADYYRRIKRKNPEMVSIDDFYDDNYMRPDGGIIWLEIRGTREKYPILISEMKTQGTNDGRREKGLEDQACGNAIERLASYILPFSMLYEFDDFIFPFVSFSCGCDFDFDEAGKPNVRNAKVQGGKLVRMMGGMSGFNKIITSKTMPAYRHIKPNTIMARKESWNTIDMVKILYEIGFDSLTYYLSEISKKPKRTQGKVDLSKIRK